MSIEDDKIDEIDEIIANATLGAYRTLKLLVCAVREAYSVWEAEHPVFYHSFDNHIEPMLNSISYMYNAETTANLVLFALFHDFRYNPRDSNIDNVENALLGMREYISWTSPIFHNTSKLIIDTLYTKCVNNTVAHISLDFASLTRNDNAERDEILMYKEYSTMPFTEYKIARINVLTHISVTQPQYITDAINKRIEFLNTWSPKIGIFAGTFNPFHIGHYEVYKQAERIFDIVIIANGVNPDKYDVDDMEDVTLPERLKWVSQSYDGYLKDFDSKFGENVTIVRGLRNCTDLEYEQNFKILYTENGGTANFVYFTTGPEFNHISSSNIRNMTDSFGVDDISKYAIIEAYHVQ